MKLVVNAKTVLTHVEAVMLKLYAQVVILIHKDSQMLRLVDVKMGTMKVELIALNVITCVETVRKIKNKKLILLKT